MPKLTKIYIWFVFGVFIISCAKTEISPKQADVFVKYFGGSVSDTAFDAANGLVTCSDGGYALTGQLFNSVYGTRACFIRTDQYGNELSFSPLILGNGNTSVGHSLCKTMDGGFLVVGYVVVTGKTDKDVLLVKIKENGTIAWTRTFPYPSIFINPKNEEGFSVSELASGNILVGGYIESTGNGGKDVYIMLLNSSGVKIWERSYGFGGNEVVNSFIKKGDYFLLMGYKESQYSPFQRSAFIVKVDTLSGIPFDTRYFGEANNASAVKSVSDGDITYILANGVNSGVSGIYLIKLKNDMQDVVWEKFLLKGSVGDDINQVGNDIILNNNQIIIIGSSGQYPDTDFLVDVLDSDGNLLNSGSNIIQAQGSEEGRAGVIGPDGRLTIAGTNIVQGTSKIVLFKKEIPK
jgi:hypothetical protein